MNVKFATGAAGESEQLPNGSQTEPPARTPTRVALAKAIARLDTASAALAAANEPIERLLAVESHARVLETKLSELADQHEIARGAWLIGGCEGLRPAPTPEQLAVEVEYGQIAGDIAAARKVRPELDAAAQRCAEAVRAAAQDRDDAMYAVAAEAARDFVNGRYRTAIAEFMACEDMLRGFDAELIGRRSALAVSASGAIRALLNDVRNALTARPAPEPGRRLFAALSRDADAVLAA